MKEITFGENYVAEQSSASRFYFFERDYFSFRAFHEKRRSERQEVEHKSITSCISYRDIQPDAEPFAYECDFPVSAFHAPSSEKILIIFVGNNTKRESEKE